MSVSSPINKIIIPEDVERKIRYLQNKFPSTEWSGVLFYTYEGDFEHNGVIITCKDIYPMDLGDSIFTQYSMSEDVSSYIAQNANELWDCELGLVHSHHSMAAFFSGTDVSTLRSEGNDTNNFVSLIVNNEGTYCAAITRKVQLTTSINSVGEYKFFGEDTPINYESKDFNQDTVIQYFMLQVEKPNIDNPFSYIDDRFKEIEERKKNQHSLVKTSYKDSDGNSEECLYPNPKQPHAYYEPSLWDKEDLSLPTDIRLDPNAVHHFVTILVTASLTIDPTKFNLENWINNSMERRFTLYFGDADNLKFKEYVEWVIQYLIDYYEDDTLLNYYSEGDDTLCYSIIAKAVYDELNSYDKEGKNPYLQAILDQLSTYLYE